VPQLKAHLRSIESEHDISSKLRIQWLHAAMATYTDGKMTSIIQQAMKRLKRAGRCQSLCLTI
jgi:hypothetical protein